MSENCESLVVLYKKCLNDVSTQNSIALTKTTAECFLYWNQLIKCMDNREKNKYTELNKSKL